MHALRYVWRSLRRAPVFTATVVLTLTIGIAASAAIFTVVNAVLLRPLPYGHPDRLVGVWHDLPPMSLQHANITQGMYFTYKEFAHTLADIAEYDDGAASVTDPDGHAEPERMDVAWTTANLFGTLDVAPLAGRTYTAAEDAPNGPPVVVISEGLWRSRFAGDRSVIGKQLVIAGRPHQIIGIMPARFQFPSAKTRLWLPRQLDPSSPFPGGFSHYAVARLAPGVTRDAAERDLTAVLPRVVEVSPNLAPGVTTQMLLDQAKPVPRLVPMRDDVVGPIARTLWVVAATAALLLLVTCANVANLLLVRADSRHRELAVRSALGAGRGRVLRQFFGEAAALAGIASVLAIGVTVAAIRVLVRAGPAEVPRLSEIHVDPATIGFTIVVALVVAVACSVVPALRFLRSDVTAALREGGRSGTAGGRRQRARSVLVAAQMAFALVVLAASGLLFRSFQRLHAVRPGFDPNGVATLWLSLPSARYPTDTAVSRFYADLARRAAQVPGVSAAGVASRVPLVSHGMSADPFYPEGDATYDKSIPPLQFMTRSDGGYFRAMGIPLVAGRVFGSLDALEQPDEAIVSLATAATFFHDSTGRAALGKRFRTLPNGVWHTIVGVVGSVHDTSLAAPVSSAVYFPEAPSHDTLDASVSRQMALVARTTGDPTAVTRSLQQLVRSMDPTLPAFDVQPMPAVIRASTARLSFTMVVLGVAAAVTLVLGIVGLYGVIAYIVTMRTREIGVRIALGAQPSSVMAMITRQGIGLSLAGVAGGIVLSLLLARFLRALLFEVAPSDPFTLAGASLTLILCAAMASWVPARRAARIDPTEALRAD